MNKIFLQLILAIAALWFSSSAQAQTGDDEYREIVEEILWDLDLEGDEDEYRGQILFPDSNEIRSLENGDLIFGKQELERLLANLEVSERPFGFRWIAAHEVIHQAQYTGAITEALDEATISRLANLSDPQRRQLFECQADVAATYFLVRELHEEYFKDTERPSANEILSGIRDIAEIYTKVIPDGNAVVEGVRLYPKLSQRKQAVQMAAHAALIDVAEKVWPQPEEAARQLKLIRASILLPEGSPNVIWTIRTCMQLTHLDDASRKVAFEAVSEDNGQSLDDGYSVTLAVRNNNDRPVRVRFQLAEQPHSGWTVSDAKNYMFEIPAKSSRLTTARIDGTYDEWGGFLPVYPKRDHALLDAEFISLEGFVAPLSDRDIASRLAKLSTMTADNREWIKGLMRIASSADNRFSSVTDGDRCRFLDNWQSCEVSFDMPGFERDEPRVVTEMNGGVYLSGTSGNFNFEFDLEEKMRQGGEFTPEQRDEVEQKSLEVITNRYEVLLSDLKSLFSSTEFRTSEDQYDGDILNQFDLGSARVTLRLSKRYRQIDLRVISTTS